MRKCEKNFLLAHKTQSFRLYTQNETEYWDGKIVYFVCCVKTFSFKHTKSEKFLSFSCSLNTHSSRRPPLNSLHIQKNEHKKSV